MWCQRPSEWAQAVAAGSLPSRRKSGGLRRRHHLGQLRPERPTIAARLNALCATCARCGDVGCIAARLIRIKPLLSRYVFSGVNYTWRVHDHGTRLGPRPDAGYRSDPGPGNGAVPNPPSRLVDLLPPCNNACPAGENIQAWLALAQAGKYRQAWEMLVRTIRCRRCTAASAITPAKPAATAASWTRAVSIHAVERFLGDLRDGGGWDSRSRRAAAASECWSSAPARAGFQPPITSHDSAIRWRSTRRGRCPAA